MAVRPLYYGPVNVHKFVHIGNATAKTVTEPLISRVRILTTIKSNLLFNIMRWQVYRLARLIGKVVRFQHRGTH